MQLPIPERTIRALVPALFFLSGATSLVYQVIWLRMLVPVFGTSVYAVSTVLAAFMAGLAIGSVAFGRLADRGRNGLRTYAWLEAGIGLCALVFPFALSGLDELYTFLYRHASAGEGALALVRFAVIFAVLLVPTTCMGATLPVLSKVVVRRLGRVGWGVGRLYALNTLGAVVGCFLAGFVLLERLGIRETLVLAAAVNLLIAGVSWLLSLRGSMPGAEPEGIRPLSGPIPLQSRYVPHLVLVAFAASGFAALGYEVVWTRLLSIVLRATTTQSLSVLLVAFLLGLALGGAVGASVADRLRDPLAVFAAVLALLGLCGLGSILAFRAIPEILAALGSLSSWWGHHLKLILAALAVMLLPTFLMGFLFPIAGRLHGSKLERLGQEIGDVYAANTGGAILGAFVAGFVLIPLAGTQRGIAVLASIHVAVGVALLLLHPGLRPGRKAALVGTALVPVLLFAAFVPRDFLVRSFGRSAPGAKLLYHDEQAAGTVTVHELPQGIQLLSVNGAGEVPTDPPSIRTFRLLGALPLLIHGSPEDVLVIAFGGGITLSEVELHRPLRIDCVEIVPGVVEGARLFARWNNGVAERVHAPPFELIAADGRNHLLRTERLYDVIIADATHPATADSWVLYTEEFYRLAASRLAPRGVVAQWLPIHGLTADDYRMVLRTFHAVFPHATLWVTPGYSVMLGTPDALRVDFERLHRGFEAGPVRASLEDVDLGDPVSLLASLALDERALAAYAGPGPSNTDDRPAISFGKPERVGATTGLPAMISLLPYLIERLPPGTLDAAEDVRQALDRRLLARKHTFHGDVALKLGDVRSAVEAYDTALSIDPGERGAERALAGVERGK